MSYFIGVDDRELFSMARIWETWSENGGEELQSVAIITTDANDVVGELHDRMPVILEPDEEQRWLEEDDETAEAETDEVTKDGEDDGPPDDAGPWASATDTTESAFGISG